MSEVLAVTETEVLVVSDVITETLTETMDGVLVEETVVTELLETAEQGPPGPPGDPSGALLVVNQLSEFDTEPKKAAARANIGLAVIDGGTFF